MRIAIAGLGTVGAAVLRLIRAQSEWFISRGHDIAVTAVSARDKNKLRDCNVGGIAWVDDARELAARDDVDLIVETIGGAGGVAYDLALATLKGGKHLVTANKAMIATHGMELARLAEANKAQLSFEAAVCGGVPIVKMLRESLSANHIATVRGILNGTCNYILTRMGDELDFAAALAEAQNLGYAESNPAADIDGHDAAQKLAILAALAFGTAPDLESIFVEGIRHITPSDLRDAATRGGRLKLLGIATQKDGAITRRVQPVFVPLTQPLSRVEGVANGVEITGDFVGELFIQGAGAGGDATASAVVADIIDIVRGNRNFTFRIAAN